MMVIHSFHGVQRAYYGTSASGSQNFSNQPDDANNAVDDGYWEDANFWNFGTFDGEVGDSGRGSSVRSVAW